MKIAEINLALEAIAVLQRGTPISSRLAYGLAKNRRYLAAAKEDYDEAMKGDYDEVLIAWEKDRIELLRRHSTKDALGNPVIDNGNVQFPEGFDLTPLLNELSDKHPKFDEAKAAQQKRMRDLADQDFEVHVHAIPMSLWPETVQASVFDALLPLIVDDIEIDEPEPEPAAAPAAPAPQPIVQLPKGVPPRALRKLRA